VAFTNTCYANYNNRASMMGKSASGTTYGEHEIDCWNSNCLDTHSDRWRGTIPL